MYIKVQVHSACANIMHTHVSNAIYNYLLLNFAGVINLSILHFIFGRGRTQGVKERRRMKNQLRVNSPREPDLEESSSVKLQRP